MMTRAIFLGIACAFLTFGQTPAFQSETKVVLVDALVTGRNEEYIRDLSAKDFRVWEDNKEQTIRSFSLETGSSAAEPRRIVLFFDNSGMSVADQGSARQAAASFIDASAGPNQLMALVTFDGGFHAAQGFTGNAGRLKEALRGVSLTGSSPNDIPVVRGQAPTAAARGLIPSVSNLAGNLAAVPGRKIIVLMTSGTSLAAARQADVTSLIQIGNRSNVAVYPVVQGAGAQDASGEAFDIGQRQQPQFRASQLTQRGATPPGGVDDVPGDSLPLAIAGGTGGFVLSGSNDVLAQLQKVVAEQNWYYVLGYTPPDSKEGACHTLRVKVDRGGTKVRSRSSYCTAKPQDLLAESQVEQDLEKRAAAFQTGNAASIQAPFFYIAPNVARVHAAMEILPETLKFEPQKGKLHAEMNILGIASGPDGGVAARFSDIVRRDFDNQREVDKWKEKPLYYEKEFKIVPGQYKLTIVFSSGGANFGKVETPLTVPAYERTQFAISGLALSSQVRPASQLGLESSLIDEGTPLIAGGTQVFPAGSNAFARSGQAFCYFEVYTADAADAVIMNPRIVDGKTGTIKWDGGTAKLDPAAKGQTKIPVGLSVPIASLPAGSWQLEVTAVDAAGKTAKRAVDFEIK